MPTRLPDASRRAMMIAPTIRQQSLRAYLLRRFLPLAILPMLVMTAWSVYVNWRFANIRGKSWVTTSTSRLGNELDELGEEAEIVKRLVARGSDEDLPALYSVIPREAIAFTKAGLYAWKGKLIYATSDGERVLAKEIDHSFAARLAPALGAELEFVVYGPAPHVVASTWQTVDGHVYLPPLKEGIQARLAALKPGEKLSGKSQIQIPGYRGLKDEDEKDATFYRGAKVVPVFYAYTPLIGADSSRIGYFGVLLPEAAVMRGMYSRMFYSLLGGLLLIALGAWLLLRASGHVAEPLVALSKRIYAATRAIRLRSSGTDSIMPVTTPSEIELLSHGVNLLEGEIARTAEMESKLAEERERTLFVSKMAAVGEMSAGIAHEINNPIAVIHALSDELQERGARGTLNPSEAVRIGAVIKDTATRVAGIVRALLRVARDGDRDPMEWTSVNSLVGDAVILIREHLTRGGITLKLRGFDEDVRVMCRGPQITQVLLNLFSNAIDALENASVKKIDVTLTKGSNSVWISVVDSGRGISPEVKGRLMEPFVTTKAPGRGTGLGLSIAKQIISEHQGKMFLDEQHTQTCFVFGLPIGRDSHATLGSEI